MQITRYNTFFFLLWSREIYFVVFDPCKDTVFLNILRREFDEVYWFIWSFLAVLEPWEAPQTQVSSCRAHWFITHTHTHTNRGAGASARVSASSLQTPHVYSVTYVYGGETFLYLSPKNMHNLEWYCILFHFNFAQWTMCKLKFLYL